MKCPRNLNVVNDFPSLASSIKHDIVALRRYDSSRLLVVLGACLALLAGCSTAPTITTTTGSATTKPSGSSFPQINVSPDGVTRGPDGNVWFVDHAEGTI